MNLTTATPAEIDAAIAELLARLIVADKQYQRAVEYIHDLVDTREEIIPRSYGRRAVTRWKMTDTAAIDAAHAATDKYGVTEALAELETARAAVAAIRDELAPYLAEFDRRGGWSRAFLVVTNGTGHVHTTCGDFGQARCSTCRPTTQYDWLTELSGATENEIIAGIGTDACQVCYPDAKPLHPRAVFTAAEKAARAAAQAERDAKATRAAAKDAKKITNPDGTPLVRRLGARFPDVIGSERDAQIEYMSERESAYFDQMHIVEESVQPDSDQEQIDLHERNKADALANAARMLEALAAKRHPELYATDPAAAIAAENEALAPKLAKKLRAADKAWAAHAEQRAYQRTRNNR